MSNFFLDWILVWSKNTFENRMFSTSIESVCETTSRDVNLRRKGQTENIWSDGYHAMSLKDKLFGSDYMHASHNDYSNKYM